MKVLEGTNGIREIKTILTYEDNRNVIMLSVDWMEIALSPSQSRSGIDFSFSSAAVRLVNCERAISIVGNPGEEK